MAAQKPSIPKGTRDFGPAEVQKRKYILNTIETVFKKYGFMPIETPTMENLSTLEGKYGDEGDKLLFRVLNSGDTFEQIRNPKFEIRNQGEFNKVVTEKGLRYDLTVPFARYVVMNRNEITFPFKRYQMQPVWRADRPQRGRYREFWQCDADVVGSDSLLNEADLVQIYIEVFNSLFKKNGETLNFKIKLNNRKILSGMAELMGLENNVNEFITILDKQDKIGLAGIEQEFREKNINVDLMLLQSIATAYFSKDALGIIQGLEASILKENESGRKGIEELKQVCTFLTESGVDLDRIAIETNLARGLSYYTGCILEVVVYDQRTTIKSSIGGGGRYDNLTGIFGLPNVSGVGISFGLDRIYDVMEELKLFPETLNVTSTKVLVCAFNEQTQITGIAIVKQLRDAGIASELYPELPKSNKEKEKPMQKPMNYADALKIPYTIILKGEGELLLKNMDTKEEKAATIQDIIKMMN